MSRLQNIFEIDDPNQILRLLERDEFFYTVCFITSGSVHKKMNKYMKKWLSVMSNNYPNVLFCFYYAKSSDFKKAEWYRSLSNQDNEKRSNMGLDLIKNPNQVQYPLSYYFVGQSDIMFQGQGIDPDKIDEAYEKLKGHYMEDLNNHFYSRTGNDSNQNQNQQSNNSLSNKKKKSKKPDPREEYKKNMLLQKEMQFNTKLERDKMNEKVKILGEFSNKYFKEFIADIKKREQIENGEYEGDTDSDDDNDSNDDNDNDNDNNNDNKRRDKSKKNKKSSYKDHSDSDSDEDEDESDSEEDTTGSDDSDTDSDTDSNSDGSKSETESESESESESDESEIRKKIEKKRKQKEKGKKRRKR